MNKQGHKQTLVPAQARNRNAQKSGVYSPAARAQRAQELAAAVADHPPDQLVDDTLVDELNSLRALCRMMDEELDKGVLGRRGNPRRLLDDRLRAADKVRRTAAELFKVAERRRPKLEPPVIDVQPKEVPPEALPERVAQAHYRESLAEVSPEYFDPETFVACVSASKDPAVTFNDRRAASRLLTRIKSRRAELCACRSTLTARHAIEMRDWVETQRERHPRPGDGESDRYVAALVRKIAAGTTTDLHPLHNLLIAAVEAVRRDATADPDPLRPRVRTDATVAPFWGALLSPDAGVKPTMRLQALAALDESGALAPCTCASVETTELAEEHSDRARAFIVQTVVQDTLHAAKIIAAFPETTIAVRDIVDEALLAADPPELRQLGA